MAIHEYDVVALMTDIVSKHPETQESIALCRGQVGTVLVDFDSKSFLVDFADSYGYTYAMETIPASQLMLLLHEPVMTAV